jgi:hypothetical protein
MAERLIGLDLLPFSRIVRPWLGSCPGDRQSAATPDTKEGIPMRRPTGRRGLLAVAVLSGSVILAGCGGGGSGSKSTTSSTTGATATQKVKRLEVTVVQPTAAAPMGRTFLAWAAELLGWVRNAEAATCTVSAPGVPSVQTDSKGKATLLNVPVDSTGTIPVSINCGGVLSSVNVTGAPGAVVAITVEVAPGKVEVKAKNEHVSEPSVDQSEPSKPSQTSSTSGSNSGHQ